MAVDIKGAKWLKACMLSYRSWFNLTLTDDKSFFTILQRII